MSEVTESRVVPPPLPEQLVRRERLLHLLDAAVRRRVTLVVAPTGYGKTTLVSQWIEARRSRRVGWLTVAPSDNDPARFEQLLRTALERAGQYADRDADPVARRGDPAVVLVLDDVQTITNLHLFDRLAADLDALPSLRLILLSRSDPVFPAYRFRLRDQVFEVRHRDLAFDQWEARDLLGGISGKKLTDEHVGALVERTEGWPAGLHLAGASIRTSTDVDGFVRTFGADDRHVADYLTEHMLQSQPADVQRFLLSTSVLDRMSSSLCDYVLDAKDSSSMLVRLERASIMMAPVDDRRVWFRYHRLLRVLLRQRLRAQDPMAERALLERAAEWHLAHDDVSQAISYLAEAGAWPRAVEAALQYAPAVLATGRAAEVVQWIELLPPEAAMEHPALLLLEASGRLAARETLEFRRILRTLSNTEGLSPANSMAADVLLAAWQVQHGSPEQAIEIADRALERAEHLDDVRPDDLVALLGSAEPLLAAAHIVRSTAMLELGDLEGSTDALAPVLTSRLPMLEARALGMVALNDALSGRLRAAERTATHALDVVEEHDVRHDATVTPALLALAMVARSRDELDEAGEFLERARHVSEPSSFLAGLALTEQAKVALALGHSDEAYALVAFSRG